MQRAEEGRQGEKKAAANEKGERLITPLSPGFDGGTGSP